MSKKRVVGKKVEIPINDALARILDRRKTTWTVDAERRMKVGGESKQPDILALEPRKCTVGIETELGDAREVEDDALKYLGKTTEGNDRIATVLAVKMPEALRDLKGTELEQGCEEAEYLVAVLKSGPEGTERWPEEAGAFARMDIRTLAACVEHNQVAPEEVGKAADALEKAISRGSKAIEECLATHPQVGTTIAKALRQQATIQTWAMATAMLTNAVSFHASIAGSARGDGASADIRPPEDYTNRDGSLSRPKLRTEWQRILREVNYWPIFSIGERLLGALQERWSCREVLAACLEAAQTLESAGILQAQEVMGLALQRLIVDRDVLKTHYTLPESATLMAQTIIERIRARNPGQEWTKLKVLDPACGTGALLSAMQHGLLRESEAQGTEVEEAHLAILRNIHGLEVMPAAAHLTATQLSSVHPTIIYRKSGIATVKFGHADGAISIGSLDFLAGSKQGVLFQGNEPEYVEDPEHDETDDRETQRAEPKVEVPHQGYDVVVMNPPFTSDTKHDGRSADVPLPSWAAFETDKATQKLMKETRKGRVRDMLRLRTGVYRLPKRKAVGDGNAGLGSWFVDLAHEKLKPGGTLGMILPHTACSGPAWSKIQELLRTQYQDVGVYTIGGGKRGERAFSCDTDLVECMIIARKMRNTSGEGTTKITLSRRPRSRTEAHAIAARALEDTRGLQGNSSGSLDWEAERSAGATAKEWLGNGARSSGALSPEVTECVRKLMGGEFRPPRIRKHTAIRLTPMEQVVRIGPVHRDLGWRDTGKARSEGAEKSTRGPLRFVGPARSGSSYPALWNHEHTRERNIFVEPDCRGQARTTGERERADQLWEEWAGEAHLSGDITLGSQPLAACITTETCFGGVAWPVMRGADAKITALWENTTPGLMLGWWESTRTQPGRARRSITTLPKHTTLDTRALTEGQREKFQDLLEEMRQSPSEWELRPIGKAKDDPARRRLDDAVLQILGASGKAVDAWWKTIVVQWCDEPSVRGT